MKQIYFPELTKITPTIHSTLIKITEESGELAKAILKFLPHESMKISQIKKDENILDNFNNILEELLDLAQTCVTMFFLLEKKDININKIILNSHLTKLKDKKYLIDAEYPIVLDNINIDGINFKYISLPKLNIPNVSLLTTVCKIQEEIGELSQFLGKKKNLSGERNEFTQKEINFGVLSELLDISQCCVTMLYILINKYDIDTDKILNKHINKLKNKQYL